MEPLPRRFFARPTAAVARGLLGQLLVVEGRGRAAQLAVRIVETEAYLGPDDLGSHARLGRHTRAGRMWAAPGTAYVYVCYGVHDCLNVVAHPQGGVGAVLLRAAEPIVGARTLRRRRPGTPDARLASGPGNLCRALGLTSERHDGVDLTAPPVYLARGQVLARGRIGVTSRIGLSRGRDRALRFVARSSPSLSHGARANGANRAVAAPLNGP